MPGQAKPYKITPTRAGSTRDLGYRSLADHAGPVPHGQSASAPQPAGPSANFYRGIAESFQPQPHHAVRSAVVAFVIGAVVGDKLARMRHGRR